MDSLADLYLALPSASIGDWTVPLIQVLYGLIGGSI